MLRRAAQTAVVYAARNIASDLLPSTRPAACGCNSLLDSASLRHSGQRSFADVAEEPVEPVEPAEVRSPAIGNERVHRIVEEIVSLNLIEVADMTELLKKRLKLDGLPGMMPMMGGGQQQVAAAPAQEAPVKEEQTEFDVTLDGFGASDKIKVIKEVRAILPELGLKDAKVLVSSLSAQFSRPANAASARGGCPCCNNCLHAQVEKTPAVIKTGLKKEEAEALKAKLEAGKLPQLHLLPLQPLVINFQHSLPCAVGGKISLK